MLRFSTSKIGYFSLLTENNAVVFFLLFFWFFLALNSLPHYIFLREKHRAEANSSSFLFIYSLILIIIYLFIYLFLQVFLFAITSYFSPFPATFGFTNIFFSFFSRFFFFNEKIHKQNKNRYQKSIFIPL